MAMDPKLMEYEDGEAKDAESSMENHKEMMRQGIVDAIKQGGDPEAIADQIMGMMHGTPEQQTDMEEED